MPQDKHETQLLKQGLNALDDFQAKVDDATWLISDPKMAKIRHISLHITRLSGSLADMCHKWEHAAYENQTALNDTSSLDPETMQRIIADFMIHAAQLNKLMGTNLFEVYAQQISRNIERYAPDSDLSLEVV